MHKKDYLNVADILKNRRLEEGLTLRELEEYSDVSRSEISTIEDKEELLKLKKALVAARDCYNLVKTFGDDELKEKIMNLTLKLKTHMKKELINQ